MRFLIPLIEMDFLRMRRAPIALFSGIGRRVAWAVIACGLVVLVLGLLLQAGKQQRQYRELHQQQLRQAAAQAALTVRTRITSAELLLRAYSDDAVTGRDAGPVAFRLLQMPMFESAALIDSTSEAGISVGTRQFTLSTQLHEALDSLHTVLLGDAGTGGLYLLTALPQHKPGRWVLVGLRGSWLWATLAAADPGPSLVVVGSDGRQLFSTLERRSEIVRHMAPLLTTPPATSAGEDLAWNERGRAWVGAVADIGDAGPVSDFGLAMVAVDPDRPWSSAFWSALRTQGTMLPLLLLLAAWFAHSLARHHLHTFRQLRRALAQLPDRRMPVVPHPDLVSEVRQLVDSYNSCAEIIEAQVETRKALDEIDGLLLPGGDYENVIDQVLIRVRSITRANNVGLTLIDPGCSRSRPAVRGECRGRLSGEPCGAGRADGGNAARCKKMA